jgi:hypothetical protein
MLSGLADSARIVTGGKFKPSSNTLYYLLKLDETPPEVATLRAVYAAINASLARVERNSPTATRNDQ